MKTFKEATELKNLKEFAEKKTLVRGWVQNVRAQKHVTFLEIRDGSRPELCQIVVKGELAEKVKAECVCEETYLEAFGLVLANEKVKGGYEVVAETFAVIGPSTPEYNTLKNESTSPGQLTQIRHLHLRDQVPQLLIRGRDLAIRSMREWLFAENYTEVTPPAIVQNQVEGGSTLFSLNYFGQEAYLTQSNQLYLESAVPVVGKCFAIGINFRAEKSRTRRHLSEFTHLEIEVPALDHEGLMRVFERFLVGVTERVLASAGDLVETLNPGFAERFREWVAKSGGKVKRLSHAEAIKFCNDNNILSDEGKPFEPREDISEAPERKMIELIGEPVLLTNFPVEQKPFYVRKSEEDPTITESADFLLPGVGEVFGGSLREGDYKTLVDSFAREGLDADTYKWYLDLRKYGTCHSGGFGLGVERYLCWLFGQDNIRKVVLYPRTCNTCTP